VPDSNHSKGTKYRHHVFDVWLSGQRILRFKSCTLEDFPFYEIGVSFQYTMALEFEAVDELCQQMPTFTRCPLTSIKIGIGWYDLNRRDHMSIVLSHVRQIYTRCTIHDSIIALTTYASAESRENEPPVWPNHQCVQFRVLRGDQSRLIRDRRVVITNDQQLTDTFRPKQNSSTEPAQSKTHELTARRKAAPPQATSQINRDAIIITSKKHGS
jgi:hypothetical protein